MRSMRKVHFSNRGFSLVEVVISMGLLIMIIGLLPMSSLIQQSNQYSMNKTYATNIALNLSEELIGVSFADLGSDLYDSCVNGDGKAVFSSSNGVCVEDLLNNTGYTELEGDGDDSYIFTRASVVCTNAVTIPGGYTDPCSIPPANLSGGPVPDELACTASDYDARTKGVKVLVTYRDRNGRCFSSTLESTKINTD